MNRFLLDTNTLSSLMQKKAAHHATISAKIQKFESNFLWEDWTQ
jgi:hypothetical protein